MNIIRFIHSSFPFRTMEKRSVRLPVTGTNSKSRRVGPTTVTRPNPYESVTWVRVRVKVRVRVQDLREDLHAGRGCTLTLTLTLTLTATLTLNRNPNP